MSARSTFWAWSQNIKHAPTKLVLLRLADRAGENERCWPAVASIVKDTGLSESEVRRCLKTLTGSGMIKSIPRKREDGSAASNYYQIMVSFSPEPTPCLPDTTPPVSQTPLESTSLESSHVDIAGKPAPMDRQARNELLEALALSSPGVVLKEIPAAAWSSISKCLKDILAVCPDLTPQEIDRRATNFCLRYEWMQPSPRALAKYWGEIGSAPPASKFKQAGLYQPPTILSLDLI